MRASDRVTIPVDDQFKIVVDNLNWVVVQTKVSTAGKNKGELIEVEVAFNHDLDGALMSIIRLKTLSGFAGKGIRDYLSWQRVTLHSMTKAVLSKHTELTEAMKVNKASLAKALSN